MLKKLSLYLLILGGIGYLGFQIYLNSTSTIFYNLIPLKQGELIMQDYIVEKRVFLNQISDDMIQHAYYINNKVALVDIEANTVLTSNNVGNNTQEIAGGVVLTDEELKNYALIYVPINADKIYSGAKINDLINLSYFIDPSLNNVLGRQFQTLYGVHAVIRNVTGSEGIVTGVDILVPNEIVNEVILLNQVGELTIVKVFTDEDQQNEVLSVSGALSEFLNIETSVPVDTPVAE